MKKYPVAQYLRKWTEIIPTYLYCYIHKSKG